MTPILISLMVERELLWYKDVVDYVGDGEEPNNDRYPITSFVEI